MDLFPDTKDFQPSNHIDLDRDAALWDDYITQQIKKVTKGKPVSIVIAWNKKDTKGGFAIGSVIVKNTQSEERFVVPIIIKKFKLAPLDTALTLDGRIFVLNENTVDEFLFDGGLAIQAVEKKEQPYDDIIPSAFDASQTTGYTKTASILATIHHTIDEKDWKRVQKEIMVPEILHKFSGAKSVFVELFKQKLVKKTTPKRQVEVIKKVGADAYVMMSNSLENFEPALQIVSSGQIRSFLDENIPEEYQREFVETADNDGVIIDWEGKADGIHIVNDGGNDKVQIITEPGFYRVQSPQGAIDGMYIKTIYEPIGDKKSSIPVFISGNGGGPQQGKVKGIAINDMQLPIREPSADDFGYFLYIYKNEPLLIGPYRIKSVAKSSFNDPELTIELQNGSNARICMSDHSSGFSVYDPAKQDIPSRTNQEFKSNRYIELTLPEKDCAWVAVNDNWQIGKLTEDMSKSASVSMTKHTNGTYEFKGLELDSNWRYPKDDNEAAFILRCCGASLEKIASVMAIANENGIVYMNTQLHRNEKKASAPINLQFVDKLKLVKIASLFEDMSTVDAMLSLNFINDDNINKFVLALPQFEKIKEELLRLLIVCRLGNIEVSETTVKQAVEIIDRVITGLNALKARI